MEIEGLDWRELLLLLANLRRLIIVLPVVIALGSVLKVFWDERR